MKSLAKQSLLGQIAKNFIKEAGPTRNINKKIE